MVTQTSTTNPSNPSEVIEKIDAIESPARLSREFTDFFIERSPVNDIPMAGYSYAFFTAPELSITRESFGIGDSIANIDECYSLNGNYLKLPGFGSSIYSNEIVASLARGATSGTFMPLLTNRARGFPAAAETLGTIDYSETWNRYKIVLGTTTRDSKVGGNFEVSFAEDSSLRIMKTMKLWMNYIEGLYLGDCISKEAMYANMDSNNQLKIDYVSSMYHFVTKPDRRTLVYWAKYTGVFPTSIPWDVFQSTDGNITGIPEVNIGFQCSYKEDMSPNILRDFNLLCSMTNNGSSILQPLGPYFNENRAVITNTNTTPGIIVQKSKLYNTDEYVLVLQDQKDPRGLVEL